jgi:hypothetical protein
MHQANSLFRASISLFVQSPRRPYIVRAIRIKELRSPYNNALKFCGARVLLCVNDLLFRPFLYPPTSQPAQTKCAEPV